MRSFYRSLKSPLRSPRRRAHRFSGYGMFGGVACAVLVVCIGLNSQTEKPLLPAPPPLGTLVDLGGYRVHVYCTGSGNPTVFIVGGAFSFDWDLVQGSVAEFTRVCSFDPSGTAWSDSFQSAVRALDPNAPPHSIPTCGDRVAEIRRVITSAAVESPYVLVGFSVGALWERLYAAHYPAGIVGMVIVDQAFLPDNKVTGGYRPPSAPIVAGSNSRPVLITQAPLLLGFEDDVNFGKLPQRDQQLHWWALTRDPVRPDEAMAVDCFAQIDNAIGNHPYPLRDMPLTVIRTENGSPAYAEMQAKLLSLSRRSRQVIAWNSSHMVPIDEPEAIVSAVQTMVESTREPKSENERH
jgi:pimeloyl-ACP methyl ester carboxylesterase